MMSAASDSSPCGLRSDLSYFRTNTEKRGARNGSPFFLHSFACDYEFTSAPALDPSIQGEKRSRQFRSVGRCLRRRRPRRKSEWLAPHIRSQSARLLQRVGCQNLKFRRVSQRFPLERSKKESTSPQAMPRIILRCTG